MIGPQRCGGGIVRDEQGNFIERFACEVHLFDPPTCAWQQAVYDEREARRAQRYPQVTPDERQVRGEA